MRTGMPSMRNGVDPLPTRVLICSLRTGFALTRRLFTVLGV
jgi:hypothetical protein